MWCGRSHRSNLTGNIWKGLHNVIYVKSIFSLEECTVQHYLCRNSINKIRGQLIYFLHGLSVKLLKCTELFTNGLQMHKGHCPGSWSLWLLSSIHTHCPRNIKTTRSSTKTNYCLKGGMCDE
ncbi:hypothetical protein NL108_003072 [Boleophthalmus pectinirostris]|nr:hypothetical protein NL108_003072 [Boleophthalmus pectinirostris]